MQLIMRNVLAIECRRLADAARWAKHHHCPGDVHDEGELIAHVNAIGRITDLDGRFVVVEPDRRRAA